MSKAVATRSPAEIIPPNGFDYASLGKDLAKRTRERAERIRGHQRTTVQIFGAIGDELLEARAELEHGFFLRWVEEEVGMSKSGAYRAMDVAERIGGRLPTLGRLPLTIVQAIAAGSTPDPVRDEVIQLVADTEAAGRKVDNDSIMERVQEARRAVKADREAAEVKAQLDKMSPEERARNDTKAKRVKRERERREAEWQQRRAADRQEALAKIRSAGACVAYLVKELGEERTAAFAGLIDNAPEQTASLLRYKFGDEQARARFQMSYSYAAFKEALPDEV